MSSASFFISPQKLWSKIGTGNAPLILDVCRKPIHETMSGLIPTSTWRQPEAHEEWVQQAGSSRPIVITCRQGHNLSQMVAADLRQRGLHAQVLEGGYQGWTEAGLPLVSRAALMRFAPKSPSLWITRRQPKIDRVACPWLIRRFIDAQARILYVEPSEVTNIVKDNGAIPFDVEGVEISHEGERCSFDTMLKLFGLEGNPHLDRVAMIVRGADTARHDLAPEAAGLHAVSLGLSALAGDDDHGMIERGFMVYDALFAWARHAAEERHNWPAKAA
jgi:rhodanese-related sulfurtransferase